MVQLGFRWRVAILSMLLIVLSGWGVHAEDSQAKIQKGEKIFVDHRCPACHAVHGKGGKVGPDLSEVGKRQDEAWLRRFLPNPKSVFSQTIMPPFKGSQEELEALVAYLASLR